MWEISRNYLAQLCVKRSFEDTRMTQFYTVPSIIFSLIITNVKNYGLSTDYLRIHFSNQIFAIGSLFRKYRPKSCFLRSREIFEALILIKHELNEKVTYLYNFLKKWKYFFQILHCVVHFWRSSQIISPSLLLDPICNVTPTLAAPMHVPIIEK